MLCMYCTFVILSVVDFCIVRKSSSTVKWSFLTVANFHFDRLIHIFESEKKIESPHK